MMKRIKFLLQKRFAFLHMEVPVLTADERMLVPVSIEVV